jgi:hypothetical protein
VAFRKRLSAHHDRDDSIRTRIPSRDLPDGLAGDLSVQTRLPKLFAFPRDRNTSIGQLSHPSEGRIAIVTDAGGMRWTRRRRAQGHRRAAPSGVGERAFGARTIGTCRGRRSRVVLTPRRWRQVGDDASHHTGDGGKKARSPGRARSKPLKPLRGESRIVSVNLWRLTRVLFILHARLRVHRASGFPCALCSRRDMLPTQLGRNAQRDRGVLPNELLPGQH